MKNKSNSLSKTDAYNTMNSNHELEPTTASTININILSDNPHLFTLSLALLLQKHKDVRIVSKGHFDNILFDGTDEAQSWQDVSFDTKPLDFGYNLILGEAEDSCDYTIFVVKPYYKKAMGFVSSSVYSNQKNPILVVEMIPDGLKYGSKFIAGTLGLPEGVPVFDIPIEKEDLVADYSLGISTELSIEKLSVSYKQTLLSLFNLINNTEYTKLRQIKKRKELQ